MSTPSPGNFNPYQSPVASTSPMIGQYGAPIDLSILKRFRREMHGLGAFWIIIGGIVTVAAVVLLGGEAPAALGQINTPVVFVLLGLGMMWVLLGVFTCLKQMWAVWVGAILSFLSLISNVVQLIWSAQVICGIIILIIVIVQANRCIKLAKQLTAAGVPLTAKPSDYMGAAPPGVY